MSLVSFATIKRSSCDRCRKQKLRCPTRRNSAESCTRCLRAGVPCVMSYTRPRGRLQKEVISQDDEDTRKPAHSALPTSDNPPYTSSNNTADDTTTQSWSLLEAEFFASLPSSCQPEQTQTHEDASADIHYSSLYGELGIYTHIDPPNLLQGVFSDAAAEFTSPGIARSDVHTASNSTPNLMRQLDCDIQLSRLNLDLCRQLQTQILVLDKCAEATVQNCTSNTLSALQDILRSMESYERVLRSLNACSDNGNSSGLLPLDRPTQSLPLTFPCILNLTSCFFHIVDVFNVFLKDLAEKLDTHDLGPLLEDFAILPELKLAGLPVHDTTLQIKILITTISHHFQTMERLLGLPAELCVSQHKDIRTRGLLPMHWVAMLLSENGELVGLNSHGLSNYVLSIQLSRNNIHRLEKIFSL